MKIIQWFNEQLRKAHIMEQDTQTEKEMATFKEWAANLNADTYRAWRASVALQATAKLREDEAAKARKLQDAYIPPALSQRPNINQVDGEGVAILSRDESAPLVDSTEGASNVIQSHNAT